MILRNALDVGVGERSALVLRDVGVWRRQEVEPARAGQAASAIKAEECGIISKRRLQGLLEPANPQPRAAARDADLRRPPASRPLPHAHPRITLAVVPAGHRVRAAAAAAVLRTLPRRRAAPRCPRHSNHLQDKKPHAGDVDLEELVWNRGMVDSRKDGWRRWPEGRRF